MAQRVISLEVFKRSCQIIDYSRVEISVEDNCAICNVEFSTEDFTTLELRKMPNCRHFFHSDCLSQWLTQYDMRCPICREPSVIDEKKEIHPNDRSGDVVTEYAFALRGTEEEAQREEVDLGLPRIRGIQDDRIRYYGRTAEVITDRWWHTTEQWTLGDNNIWSRNLADIEAERQHSIVRFELTITAFGMFN